MTMTVFLIFGFLNWRISSSADFDNDGLVDTYVPQTYNIEYAHSLLFKNKGNFRFEDVGNGIRVIDSYAGAFADLNNDGRQDLVVSGRLKLNAEPSLRVYKNISQNSNNFIKFKLLGEQSGTYPVGAQIRIKHKNGIFVRQFEGNTGTLNQQNDPIIHFGLGRNVEIQSVQVVWPSGIKQNLKSHQFLKNSVNLITEFNQ